MGSQRKDVESSKDSKAPFNPNWTTTPSFQNALTCSSPPSTSAFLAEDDRSYLNLRFSQPLSNFDPSRQKCPACESSRPGWCYKCCQPLYPDPVKYEKELPVKVDIIHHYAEAKSKSSIPYLLTASNKQLQTHHFPTLPTYDPRTTYILLPGPDSTPISALTKSNLDSMERLLVLDSSWVRVLGIRRDEGSGLGGLRCVQLDLEREGGWRPMFWRWRNVRRTRNKKGKPANETPEESGQTAEDGCIDSRTHHILGDVGSWISSAEAVYLAIKEVDAAKAKYAPTDASSHGAVETEKDEHKYDDLLYYFAWQAREAGRNMVKTFERRRAGEARGQSGAAVAHDSTAKKT
ncbi:hypothetical protein SAICODRAFT_8638 [Saitoella complicata NRRL Y-17804]|uniref:Uncharacterized protein n=1 Tax=Saitoella complicata (strain BCRC 22490 / CBS 7301 / JCM 7358 / NBRC 10748 / NRRL Y-17804) TaxID=698492 RepID=A0A0E9NMM5_SAICN|nr:uncharacterized protein SAICODRAFT_8638 [Saitoella complicata NRRL Y-17804]ODQ51706.1 hypothetical protein SAICODRAFT_8638 [Saitoella complicata NRRL Y-17804]GAO50675.1 hypothetical protein G7K_4797-t1 [Saitoella complicata NRRL Y-17804]